MVDVGVGDVHAEIDIAAPPAAGPHHDDPAARDLGVLVDEADRAAQRLLDFL